MRAVILAAGIGRRMRPLSDRKHKALLPIAGGTILGRMIDSLLANAIRDITVVTGYRSDEIREFLAEHYPQVAFRFVHNARFAETNNIHSLALALAEPAQATDVVLLESDLILDAALITRLLAAKEGNVALVDRYRAGMDGTVVAVTDGVITHIYPTHSQGSDFSFDDKFKTVNVYKFAAATWNTSIARLVTTYASLDDNCYYENVLGMLVYMQRERIHALQVDSESWAEVDDPNDLAVARFTFEPARRVELLAAAFGGHWNYPLLDFSLLRNARFPPPSVVSAMKQQLGALLANYGSSQAELNQKLSWFLLCPSQRVQLLNGASQVYPWLAAWLGTRRALIPSPTFGEYARAFPDHRTYADRPGRASFDPRELDAQLDGCDTVVFVSPNNPTGTTCSTQALHDFARTHADRTIVVDESFVDFCDEESLQSQLERSALDNVVVIKSLGKALGVPGLRLGYLYSTNERWIAAAGRYLPIWNLNAPAEFFIEILLKYRPELQASFVQSRLDREAFARDIRRLPHVAQVHADGGNFLLFEVASGHPHAGALAGRLLQRSAIQLKDLSGRLPGGGHWYRCGVRLPEENQRLVRQLGAALALDGDDPSP